jgi:hypothetical protein
LEARGIPPELVRESLSTLEPESARAARILERHGVSSQTLARLARRGFCEATLEPYLGRLQSEDVEARSDMAFKPETID